MKILRDNMLMYVIWRNRKGKGWASLTYKNTVNNKMLDHVCFTYNLCGRVKKKKGQMPFLDSLAALQMVKQLAISLFLSFVASSS